MEEEELEEERRVASEFEDEETGARSAPGRSLTPTFHICLIVLLFSVPRGGGSFKRVKVFDASVEHVASHMFLRSLCLQKTVYASPNPEMITIYYYKSDFKKFRGIPVVLNFTGSDCFLKCSKEEERILLQVEVCEKQKLQKISKSDEGTLSFVFYMKGDRTDDRTFESALHLGWFIQIVNTDSVEVTEKERPEEDNHFRVIIQKN
ncbi:uncharacterized protein LOC115417202 [Sphaeramia orbicularis]|uniref:uncharacterized protein LOC115417202 n=1 Tax=Sphaeramia orbicularis TaxID=375764 RepID=UPI00117BE3B8|nr:uncharacterized protein LOC115417202 [Sphaeramia orbicularis]